MLGCREQALWFWRNYWTDVFFKKFLSGFPSFILGLKAEFRSLRFRFPKKWRRISRNFMEFLFSFWSWRKANNNVGYCVRLGDLILSFFKPKSNYNPKGVRCGGVKHVVMRNKSGKAICSACYQRSKVGECAKCKETKVIQALGLCYCCYQRQRRASMAARPA
jgi:hypothetical protein